MWDLVGPRTISLQWKNHKNIQGKSTLHFFQEEFFNSYRMAVLPCNTCNPSLASRPYFLILVVCLKC